MFLCPYCRQWYTVEEPCFCYPRLPEQTTPSHEDAIRRLAFQLYERRGREDGHDVEDWLHAEHAIKRSKSRSVAA